MAPRRRDPTRRQGILTVTRIGSRDGIGRDWRNEAATRPHYRHRFPAEIICYAVWLYHVFSLSLRDVELLLAERGVVAPTRR